MHVVDVLILWRVYIIMTYVQEAFDHDVISIFLNF
jgi:hypothetical protein